MPAISNPHRYEQSSGFEKKGPQKVCIIVGISLIMVGLIGTLIPLLLSFHQMIVFTAFYIGSGVISLICGFKNKKNSLYYCLIFGTGYGLLGIIGFILGVPGYSTFGNLEADQNLLRIIPNAFELGSVNHIAHILLSVFLIYTAYTFRRI